MAKGAAIDLSGPFFRNDPGQTFRQNARRLVDETADQGKLELEEQMRSGESGRARVRLIDPPRVSAHIVVENRVRSSRPDEVVATVKIGTGGMSARQAISARAAGSEIEKRSHPGKRTATVLRRVTKLNAAELLKGIA